MQTKFKSRTEHRICQPTRVGARPSEFTRGGGVKPIDRWSRLQISDIEQHATKHGPLSPSTDEASFMQSQQQPFRLFRRAPRNDSGRRCYTPPEHEMTRSLLAANHQLSSARRPGGLSHKRDKQAAKLKHKGPLILTDSTAEKATLRAQISRKTSKAACC